MRDFFHTRISTKKNNDSKSLRTIWLYFTGTDGASVRQYDVENNEFCWNGTKLLLHSVDKLTPILTAYRLSNNATSVSVSNPIVSFILGYFSQCVLIPQNKSDEKSNWPKPNIDSVLIRPRFVLSQKRLFIKINSIKK